MWGYANTHGYKSVANDSVLHPGVTAGMKFMNIMSETLDVYIPELCQLSHIKPKSGIVAHQNHEDHVTIYYEGDIFGGEMTYEEKVHIAAGRCIESYPTIARMRAPKNSLILIGEYDYKAKRLVLDLEHRDDIERWLGKCLTKNGKIANPRDMLKHPSYQPTVIVTDDLEGRIPMYDIVPISECIKE